MLPHSENEGVVDSEAGALRLRDIEIVALGVGRRMANEEIVGRVSASMGNWQGEGERVRVVFDRMHQATPAGIDLQSAMTLVAREECFDCVAFLAADPFCLRECTRCGRVPAFKYVAISITGESLGFDFGETFNV